MEKVVLYKSKSECCGCGACMNICPKNAISMVEDECGFIYPKIDETLCVHCLACKRVCAFQSEDLGVAPIEGYAAANEEEEQKSKSSSGGAFAAIAEPFLLNGGVVYGTGYADDLSVVCTRIEKIEELQRLQGSKYVQSHMGDAYRGIKNDLKNGKPVLFSGTPCQIAAVRKYMGDRDNLYTVDIVCHGVPSQRMMKDYLALLGDVEEIEFRDKSKGWENFFIRYRKHGYHHIHCRLSSYYEYFLQGKIYRENCYSCKYAAKERFSDLTIGDYWGIRKSHPDLITDGWWKERLFEGISCVLVNTERGKKLLQRSEHLKLAPSDYEKISRDNGQLKNPTPYTEERERILKLYRDDGWVEVDKDFFQRMGIKQRIKYQVKALIPVGFKRNIKRVLG